MSNPLNNYMNVEDKITAPGDTGAAGSNPVLDALNKNYALQTASLDKKYTAAQAELEASRLRGKKEASVNNTKLMKYLPSILKRQGLSGLGVSQTATISANNNFRKSLTDIEAAHSKSSAELLGNYADAKLAYDTEYNTKAAELQQKAIDDKNAAEEKQNAEAKAEMDANFKNAWSIISSDTESLDFTALLESYKGKVSDADYQTLVNLAASQVAENTAAKTDKETEKTDKTRDEARAEALMLVDILSQSEKYDEGLKYLETVKDVLGDVIYGIYKGYFESELGKISGEDPPEEGQIKDAYSDMTENEIRELTLDGKYFVSHDGKDYQLKETLDRNSNEIVNNNDFKAQLSEMGFNNAYDLNIPEGTTITIKCDKDGSNSFRNGDPTKIPDEVPNWLKGMYMPSTHTLREYRNMETRTLTWYNGEWHISEDKGNTRNQSNTDATTSVPAASLDVYKQYTGGGAIGGSNIPTRK